jgi:hypothetical protein
MRNSLSVIVSIFITAGLLWFSCGKDKKSNSSEQDKAAAGSVEPDDGVDTDSSDPLIEAGVAGTVSISTFEEGSIPKTALMIDASGFNGGAILSQSPVLEAGQISLTIPEEIKLLENDKGVATALVALTPESLESLPNETATLAERVAAAKKFRFVTLPAAKESLVGLPIGTAEKGVKLGTIDGSGTKDEVTTSETAFTSGFSLTADVLSQWSRADNCVKAARNDYINLGKFRASPFFLWKAAGLNIVRNATSTPDNFVYSGYGFYISAEKPELFTFDNICGTNGQTQKSLQLVPPDTVVTRPDSVTDVQLGPTNPFNNANPSLSSQNGSRVCNGSATGFYMREDVMNGHTSFMLNWGTGGSIQGNVPAGMWYLRYENVDIAAFDLESTQPIDSKGKAWIYVPTVTVTTVTTDNIEYHSRIAVNFHHWNSVDQKWVKIADPTIFESLATRPVFSVSTGSDETRFAMTNGTGDDLFVVESTAVSMDGSQKTLGSLASVSENSYATGYEIGRVSFRFEVR